MSVPRGHMTAVAAGYIFLSLYFNAKMKINSGHHNDIERYTIMTPTQFRRVAARTGIAVKP